jgi:hypothetical protein
MGLEVLWRCIWEGTSNKAAFGVGMCRMAAACLSWTPGLSFSIGLCFELCVGIRREPWPLEDARKYALVTKSQEAC